MTEQLIQVEMRLYEEKLRSRYFLFLILFLIVAILLITTVAVVFSGISYADMGYNWAALNIEGWIILSSIILLVFIILSLFLYTHINSVRNKIIELEKPKPEFVNGKMVHVYTHPKEKEGGLFSKTYIEIDEHNILRLRTLMVPPEEVW